MRCGVLLAAAAVLGGGLVVPAAAKPTVDQLSTASASFSFYSRAARANFLVDVRASFSQAGLSMDTGAVEVSIRRCAGISCSKPTRYVAVVTKDQFEVQPDLSSGFLGVSLFGKPLELRWQGARSGHLPAYEFDTNVPRAGARVYQITWVKGVVAGRPCMSGDGVLAQGVLVDGKPPEGAKALPAKAPRSLAGLLQGTCATFNG